MNAPAINRRLLLAYTEASKNLAAPLARALEAAGFEVEQTTGPVAETTLAAARTVIVGWTPAAVASDTVALLAARARKAGKLASVLLAPCTPPGNLGDRSLLADLSGWHGDASERDFIVLVQAIHARQANRFLAAPIWRSQYLSVGSIGAVAIGGIALVANIGGLTQTIDGLANPAASQRDLSATNARVEEVLSLLKQNSSQKLSTETEAALRESIQRLLDAQDGARGAAAEKLAAGDFDGAMSDLKGAADEGEKVVATLSETWMEIGALAYLSDTFAALHAYKRAAELTPDNIEALSMLGGLYYRTGRLDEARRVFATMTHVAEDPADHARALGSLGSVALAFDELDEAEQYFRQSLNLNQKAGAVAAQGLDLNDLGEIMRLKGNFADAEAMLRRALQLARDSGHAEGEANAHLRLGALAHEREQLDKATAEFTRAREISEQIGDKEGAAGALNSLGAVQLDRGQLDAAKAMIEEALELAADIAARESEAYAHTLLGDIAAQRGDAVQAIGQYREAMFIYRANGQSAPVEELNERLKALGATPAP